MSDNSFMPISEFARITGISRPNLIFYDKIGLLSPEHRGENRYRYYTRHQLGSAFLIASLREVGIGIDEIKKYADQRTPEKMIGLFSAQKKKIESDIIRLTNIKGMLGLYTEMAGAALQDDIEKIHIKEQKKEPLFLGEPVLDENEDEALIRFYDLAASRGVTLSYPFGTIIPKARLLDKKTDATGRYYLKIPFTLTDFKPAGRYVTGYTRGDYGQSMVLYRRLLDYIEENRLMICGDAYEEYPLGEASTINPEDYLIKVAIMIE